MTAPARKVTISIDAAVLDQVDALASAAGLSRSEWLTEAATELIRLRELRDIIDRRLELAGGPLTDEERAQACHELGLPAREDGGRGTKS